jgi:hypothetical protein
VVCLTPERAAELVQRAATGTPKSVFASDYGISISRETVYQYLRQCRPAGSGHLPTENLNRARLTDSPLSASILVFTGKEIRTSAAGSGR